MQKFCFSQPSNQAEEGEGKLELSLFGNDEDVLEGIKNKIGPRIDRVIEKNKDD